MNGFCEIPTLRNPCFCLMFAWLADDGSVRNYGVSGMVCHVRFFLFMFVFYRLMRNSVRMWRFSPIFCVWSTMTQRDISMDGVGVERCMPRCARGLCCPDPARNVVAARLRELTGGPCGYRLFGAKGAFAFFLLSSLQISACSICTVDSNPWSHVQTLHEDKTGCNSVVRTQMYIFFSFHPYGRLCPTSSICLTYKPGSHEWVSPPFLLRFLP
ncbi:unnamed protein product [Ectocarpus sp. 13 AM-2016]